jgi:hypothetical protein
VLFRSGLGDEASDRIHGETGKIISK